MSVLGNNIADGYTCPACGAPAGQSCRTVIDGVDTHWTHDARVYQAMGVRVA